MSTRKESVEILKTTVERVIACMASHVPLANDSAGVIALLSISAMFSSDLEGLHLDYSDRWLGL